jgi:hypothetical protein
MDTGVMTVIIFQHHIKGDPHLLIPNHNMPSTPKHNKNVRALNREVARLTRLLKKTQDEKDVFVERCLAEAARTQTQAARAEVARAKAYMMHVMITLMQGAVVLYSYFS